MRGWNWWDVRPARSAAGGNRARRNAQLHRVSAPRPLRSRPRCVNAPPEAACEADLEGDHARLDGQARGLCRARGGVWGGVPEAPLRGFPRICTSHSPARWVGHNPLHLDRDRHPVPVYTSSMRPFLTDLGSRPGSQAQCLRGQGHRRGQDIKARPALGRARPPIAYSARALARAEAATGVARAEFVELHSAERQRVS